MDNSDIKSRQNENEDRVCKKQLGKLFNSSKNGVSA